MSDASVAKALRSNLRLVVVEAPAGCGKTFQGGRCAREIASNVGGGRILILTHTHAACDAFAAHTHEACGRVEIRTIDSLIGQMASIYHLALGLPSDTGTWARRQKDGYSQLASKVARLVRASPVIARSLALRYPVIVCDEHQDANADQEALVMACHSGGASVRVFGDPMQCIFGTRKNREVERFKQRWAALKQNADIFDNLDQPHRWSKGSEQLGQWIRAARTALRDGGQIDLSGPLPLGLSVIIAENKSPKQGGYHLTNADGRPIYKIIKERTSILVLAAQNQTVKALRAFFGRRLPIWEGHVRDNLSVLVDNIHTDTGNPCPIARALVAFVQKVATGFSKSAFGDKFLDEVTGGCVGRRSGKPAKLQALARTIVDLPNHKGAATALRRLNELIATDPAFKTIKIDYHREFWDAVRIGDFDDPNEGFAEISRRRSYARTTPPANAISTIHKAKGLERSHVLIVPCDAHHFDDSEAARCRLYVAISRATKSLTFVASRRDRSPLVLL